MKRCFIPYDRDGDGYIATKDLGTVMRSLSLYTTETQLQDLITEFDAAESGWIRFVDFVDIYLKH